MPAFRFDFAAAGDSEDREHQLQVQRELDAFQDGQRAGHLLLGPEANKYPHGSPEHREFERGRRQALDARMAEVATREKAQRLAAELRGRARRPCVPCTCGGTGRCLDAA